MASLKVKDIQRMGKGERTKKLEELRMELIKSKIGTSKIGNSRTREIKKIIARLITLNK